MTKDEAIEILRAALEAGLAGGGGAWKQIKDALNRTQPEYIIEAPTSEAVGILRVFRDTAEGDVLDISTTNEQFYKLLEMDGAELFAAPVLAAVGVEKPQQGRRKILMESGIIDVTPATQPAAAPAPTDAGISISDEREAAYEAFLRDPGDGEWSTRLIWNAAWQARGQQQAGVADGWKLAPIEPTAEMKLASKRYKASTKITTGPGFYRAMIAAAPKWEGWQ